MSNLPTLQWFTDSIEELEGLIPPPQMVHGTDGFNELSYVERSLEQAVLLKSARYVSALSAASVLLEHRFLVELGALQRFMDETGEEVELLARNKLYGEGGDIANRLLSSFWEDEPTFDEFRHSQKNKDAPPRAKVIAQLARTPSSAQPNSEQVAIGKFIARTYSGFVHGAAPHLNMLIDWRTRKLQVGGIVDPSLLGVSQDDFANYSFRGVLVMAWAAATLGCDDLRQRALEQIARLKPRFHGF